MTDRGVHEKYMQLAVDESRKCIPSEGCYSVGAVVVSTDGKIFTGYTGETGPHDHAEESAFNKALGAGSELRGATIYSTMEPCSNRKSKPLSCTGLIIEYSLSEVYYAIDEPAVFTVCEGRNLLRSAGIKVERMDSFAGQVTEINSHLPVGQS